MAAWWNYVLVWCSLLACLLPCDKTSADLIKQQSLGFQLECASHKILMLAAMKYCMVLCFVKARTAISCDTSWTYLQSVSWLFPFYSQAGPALCSRCLISICKPLPCRRVLLDVLLPFCGGVALGLFLLIKDVLNILKCIGITASRSALGTRLLGKCL